MGADVHCGNCRWAESKGKCSSCGVKWRMWEPGGEEGAEGLKYDQEKLDLSLIPPEALEVLAGPYQFGIKKYEKNSWAKGIAESRLFAAMLRHYVADRKGEAIDTESGYSHLSHLVWNALTIEILRIRRGRSDEGAS